VKKKFKKRKFELKENVLAYWSAKEGKSAESEFSVRRRAHRCSAVCRRLIPLSLAQCSRIGQSDARMHQVLSAPPTGI
jgi:hypothetical protein